jgi:hypothetical protein
MNAAGSLRNGFRAVNRARKISSMKPRPGAALLLVLLAARADGGQILKFSEEGTKDGRATRSALTLSVSPAGVRVEATDLSAPGAPKTVVYLWVAKDDRIIPVDPRLGPVISASTIRALGDRIRVAGLHRPAGAISMTPAGEKQRVGPWTCDTWSVRRPGQPPATVCLADPKAVGVDPATRENLRRMNDLFVPFSNAVRLGGGDTTEAVNMHGLAGGFPVREVHVKDGAVESDLRLVSVENADLPPDLFRPPVSRAAPPAADRTIPLEEWARRGMPDAGRAWSPDDYTGAATLLEAAAKESPALLPRGSSALSGALYRRLVDPANLGAVRGTGPLDERARSGAAILSGVDRISLVYAAAYRDDASRGADFQGLMSFTLLVAHDVVPLADASVAAAPERKRTHAALASVVNACLVSLAAPGGFRPEERLRLARAVEEHVPSLSAYLPDADQRNLPARLRKMSAAEKDPAVKDALDRAAAALSKPPPRAG